VPAFAQVRVTSRPPYRSPRVAAFVCPGSRANGGVATGRATSLCRGETPTRVARYPFSYCRGRPSLEGCRRASPSPNTQSRRSVASVETHSGKSVPPLHLPSGSWAARSCAPHPWRTTRARSAATASGGASVRSRMTCQRMAGPESRSQSTTSTRHCAVASDGRREEHSAPPRPSAPTPAPPLGAGQRFLTRHRRPASVAVSKILNMREQSCTTPISSSPATTNPSR